MGIIYLLLKEKKCQEEEDVQEVVDQAAVAAVCSVVVEVPAHHAQQLVPQDQQLDQHQQSKQHQHSHKVWAWEAVVSWAQWQQVWLSEPVVQSLTRQLTQ